MPRRQLQPVHMCAQPFHHSYAHGLTLEKVGYPQLILCCCIHLHALAAVKRMFIIAMVVIMMGLVTRMIMVMVMAMFLVVAVMTGLTEQKTSPKNILSLQSIKQIILKVVHVQF